RGAECGCEAPQAASRQHKHDHSHNFIAAILLLLKGRSGRPDAMYYPVHKIWEESMRWKPFFFVTCGLAVAFGSSTFGQRGGRGGAGQPQTTPADDPVQTI